LVICGKVINNSAVNSVGFVPSRLLLDLRGTSSVELESESESGEEEIYSTSSILMDVGLRRGDGAGTADASRRRRVVNVERSSTKGSLYTRFYARHHRKESVPSFPPRHHLQASMAPPPINSPSSTTHEERSSANLS
jgi:hypothetical protein